VSLSQFQLSLHILFHDASTKRTMGTAIGRLVLALTLVSVLAGMTVAELSSTSLCRRWSHQGKFVQKFEMDSNCRRARGFETIHIWRKVEVVGKCVRKHMG
jgi:hypothetical protein